MDSDMVFILSVPALLAVAWGAHYFWLRRVRQELDDGAAVEYQRFLQHEEALLAGMTETRFSAVYQAAHRPRLPKYSLLTISAFILGTPAMFAMLSAGVWYLERTAPPPSAITETFLLNRDGSARILTKVPPDALHYVLRDWSGFYYFFGMLSFWIGVCALLMYFFHKRRPAALHTQLLRARAASHPDDDTKMKTRSQ